MIATYTEKDHLLLLDTPLGADKLLLHAYSGIEALSEPFRFILTIRSEDYNLNFDDIVGQKVTFGVRTYEAGQPRYLNGHVRTFVQLPGDERLARYQAEVVPWLWFLKRTTDCRIFQNMTVPAIVQQVFDDFGFKDYQFRLQGHYDPWEYCVQYRETAFNFISRLLEQEGIFYFFKHEKTKHVMVLGDSPSVHEKCPGHAKVVYDREGGPGVMEHEDVIRGWRYEQDFRSGKLARTDYNFESPSTKLLTNATSQIHQGGNDRFELFDFPGEYEKLGQGDQWSEIRMEEEEEQHAEATGEGNCRGFATGYKFELMGFERHDQNAAWVLTRIRHSAEEGSFYSGAGSGTGTYTNHFSAIPDTVRFRPRRATHKPTVAGAQTAVVTGPGGEEIYTDKYGRVKVQFHWDRRGKDDEQSSCWIRVSQPWAGKQWGAISIPRIGQEVIVDFLEGDPDRPIITGRVYNAVQMPPYELPAEQTKTTFKTHSSKGGGGFNELRFEDKKGSEQVFVHGEKDLDVRVENDRREWTGRDRSLIVKRDRKETVERDGQVDVRRDMVQLYGRDCHLKIGGKEAIEVGGSYSLTVHGPVVEHFGGPATSMAGGTYFIKGANVVIEGATGLTIKCGGSHVTLNPGGVIISGPMVSINSGGGALSASAVSAVLPIAPLAAALADNGQPGGEDRGKNGDESNKKTHDDKSDENKDKTGWIEIQLVDEDNKPVPGEPYSVTLPDGSVADGTLDEKGFARIDHIDPGSCQITFPNLDKNAWGPK